MMSGAAFPVHLIQMKLFLCVFLSRKSACKEDRSLTKQNIQVIYDYCKKYRERLDIANLEEEEER
jgi:hypothetical protein